MGIPEIVGSSSAVSNIKAMLSRAARSSGTVLLLGESGTGKELFARFLHNLSERQNGPFIAVNCSAIPDGLIESELFGHTKGAFTDAVTSKPGMFELADKGTILLDEIGDLSFSAQAKVLRVIQEKTFWRVGGVHQISVDVRIVAATNQNLFQAVREKKFRADLFYRLNVVTVPVPALRERREDIPELVGHFVEKHRIASGVGLTPRLTPEACERLIRYDWPGNVRELENSVLRAMVLYPEKMTLDVDDFEFTGDASGPAETVPPYWDLALRHGYGTALHVFTGELLKYALRQTGENFCRAAELIGMPRRTFYRYHERGNPGRPGKIVPPIHSS